ncbi:MAG: SCO1664 family protein [Anaerolineales bacterium]|nr:SCO1664 family protein [Anaerolineales bacterium]
MADAPPVPDHGASRPVSAQTVLRLLQDGALALEGLLPYGSNYTFLVRVSRADQTAYGVYKPIAGERPLWDFPENTLAYREVAAYRVSEALGWRLVPPTVFRGDGPHGPGSLQYFIRAQPEFHYFNLEEADRPHLRRVALFDVLINNADRKGGHVLKDLAGQLWLIDHGLGFNTQPKLRTVIWDFAGEPIEPALLADIERFRARLDEAADLPAMFADLLDPPELAALRRRADKLLTARRYPEPGSGRSYPWPPV